MALPGDGRSSRKLLSGFHSSSRDCHDRHDSFRLQVNTFLAIELVMVMAMVMMVKTFMAIQLVRDNKLSAAVAIDRSPLIKLIFGRVQPQRRLDENLRTE